MILDQAAAALQALQNTQHWRHGSRVPIGAYQATVSRGRQNSSGIAAGAGCRVFMRVFRAGKKPAPGRWHWRRVFGVAGDAGKTGDGARANSRQDGIGKTSGLSRRLRARKSDMDPVRASPRRPAATINAPDQQAGHTKALDPTSGSDKEKSRVAGRTKVPPKSLQITFALARVMLSSTGKSQLQAIAITCPKTQPLPCTLTACRYKDLGAYKNWKYQS